MDGQDELPDGMTLTPEIFPERPAFGEGAREALDRVFQIIYDELRRIARRQLRSERDSHTLTTTALVHEAYLKLVDQNHATWSDRAQFRAVAAQAMRRILVDYARRYRAARRGGPDIQRVQLEDIEAQRPGIDAMAHSTGERADILLALDEALARLGTESPRIARIVECRFFAGLSEKETADALGISQRTAARDWTIAKGWLYQELRIEPEHTLG